MSERGGERVFRGVPASGRIAVGTVVLEDRTNGRGVRLPPVPPVHGTPDEEKRALTEAIARADRELDALIEAEDELAAGILEFQRVLLEDDDLIDPIFAEVNRGGPADAAWAAALDREIADYRAGDDPGFSARADDLVDLRDRVLRALHADPAGDPAGPLDGPPDGLYVGRELTPSRFLALDWTRFRGAALEGGSRTSHVAILARSRGIPLVVGLEDLDNAVRDGEEAVLDAVEGRLIVSPGPETVARARRLATSLAKEEREAARFLARPAVTADGERVTVLVNADLLEGLEGVDARHCDGIGLVRTEFLFRDRELPDEETQLDAYRRFLAWAAGRPVTIRTLDAGGDKPIDGLTVDGESNPFLGVRGVRLSLARPEVLRTQLRALARAAAEGPLKIMVPMVTAPEEIERVRGVLDAVMGELEGSGRAHARPPLGMMVEVPAAALDAGAFDVAFFSIGSNDLVQYVTAAARDNPQVAALADPRAPVVLRLIREVAAAGRERGVEVSLCGDMASEPDLVPALLEAGVRVLSVAPAALGPVKAAVAAWRTGEPGPGPAADGRPP